VLCEKEVSCISRSQWDGYAKSSQRRNKQRTQSLNQLYSCVILPGKFNKTIEETMRKTVIAGNWKMNNDLKESQKLIVELKNLLQNEK